MKKIIIINGVNLGELGNREPDWYGNSSFEEYLKKLRADFPELEIDYFQSNSLDLLVDKILSSKNYDGIVLNPGAFTHTSIVLADAIKAISVPVVEVHISNVAKREKLRRESFISAAVIGTITGFGLKSYRLALDFFSTH
ncbi:MAG TPA: type II 3-dehydroquinate dehydratase [Bacteroidales bacterium]|nr:type II 3-dehydroquinate dehydratase [Bacteroidales bacterium]HOH22154.1 type II 3-dehydroquinate dehydratase [Bacteroidales bacterium]HPB57717.1 type II 3-dehydroquinate dehydratase [Bacteroidales bacterium]HPZ02579.1 type II 3-dehydroquinate dehydratase [Bacteroidales bacterium]HQB74522.1 type II 3-dehydroquinate dehydratase [Bacteroidales bacterium]